MRLTILGLMLAAAPLGAQERPARSGFWWGIGGGYGVYHHTCTQCDRPTGTAGLATSYLAVGGTVNAHLTLGVELASGFITPGGWTTSLSGVATLYPWATRWLFFRGGAGTSSYRQGSYVEYPPYTGSGYGWLAAVGWDLRVPRGPSFSPMITYRAGAPGLVSTFAEIGARNLRQRSVAITLGLTFH
jgi:hypothetical protein